MPAPLRALIVEDSEDDVRLLQRQLQKTGFHVISEWVDNPEAMKAALDNGAWDVVISDYAMPRFNGFAALRLLKESGLDLPFILMASRNREDVALEAMKAGADDYVEKTNLARLGPAIRREMRTAALRKMVSESAERREQGEAALRESEERYRTLVETSPDGIVVSNLDGAIIMCNHRAVALYGAESARELLGKKMMEFVAIEDRERAINNSRRILQIGCLRDIEYTVIRRDGAAFPAETSISPVLDAEGKAWAFVAVVKDITERKRTEAALERRLAVEEALARVSSNLARGDTVDLVGVLSTLAEVVNASRAYIFQLRDGGKTMDNTHEWCARGVEPQIHMLQNLDSSVFPWWMDKVIRNENIIIPDVAALPDEAANERDILQAQDIKSLAVVPMSSTGGPLGFLGFDDIQGARAWPEEDVRLLRTASETLVAYLERKQAQQERLQSVEKLRKTLEETIHAMALTVEIRDPYTAGHQRRVAELACAIAGEMGLSDDRAYATRLAAAVHDIGKMCVPTEILAKPGAINDVEKKLIRAHSRVGYDILKSIDFPWPIADIVLQHHERLDGSGYPLGLVDGDIILEARILAIADVTEAMASHRPYRPALGVDKALEEITLNKGTLYDAQAAEACARLLVAGRFAFPDQADSVRQFAQSTV
ncbi:MAG: PAS domain S-box protein [Chloroflexi bacterium]|nr:PAS domain S-box protein [Chloroflexota bacterium]